MVLLAALAGGLGYVLADTRGASLFAFASLLASLGTWWLGDRALLGMLGARPLALAEAPLVRSHVDRIAAALGVVPPKLYLVDDGLPFAFAVGRGPRSSAVAVSTGLLVALPQRELEAVLAHELAHVRRRDVLPQTLAALLGATLLEVSRIGGWLSRALLFVLAPVAAAFSHLLLSPKRELAADRTAALVLEDADAVADALVRLDRAAGLVEFRASPATEPLYPVGPFAEDDRLAAMFASHPPLARRLAALGRDGAASPQPGP